MITPSSHARATAAPRAWVRVRHGAFLLALRAFDAWMGANEKKREAVSLLAVMATSLLTIFAFAGLFLAVLKALWTQAYPWVKQLTFIAPDVAFATGLTASGLLLEGGMEADDPSRQRGLDPGAVQGLTPRARSVGVDSRFTGTRWGFCLNRVERYGITGP